MIETTLNGKTKDIVQSHIEQLKQIFPEIVTENNIDFDKLKEILGEEIDDTNERYNFTWKGKHESIKTALTPSEGTLRPNEETSKNWETTENLYIEGDNLEVLRILQKAYYNKIKMMYIDPPYNTGHDFVYEDNFKDNLKNYLEQDEEGFNVSSNPETSGRYHTNWLNMMYPRLKLARNLLSEDGFIAISIGEEELYNLQMLCNEIFGEMNFRNIISVRRYDKNLNLQFIDKGLSTMNVGLEYILIYSKNTSNKMKPVFRESNTERSKKGYWKGFWNNADRPTMRYEILGVTPTEGQWKWKKEVAYEAIKNYQEYEEKYSNMTLEEYWEKTGKNKRFIRKNESSKGKNKGIVHWVAPAEGILRNSNWSDLLVSKPAGYNIKFDSPKNVELLEELIKLLNVNDNDIVLDYFSGSSSTADAILQYNKKSGNSVKFIMVQLPEKTNEKSDAYKDGFNNICEIGEERIRRAGDKLIEENPDSNIDIGFKVFKLDSSNLTKWNPDADNLEGSLINARDNIVEGRNELDLVYEIMLKYGLELTLPVEEIKEDNYCFYSVGLGSLVICLNNHIKRDIAEKITKIKNELKPSVMRVVFKDNGFESDSDKTNIKEILRNNEIDEFITI